MPQYKSRNVQYKTHCRTTSEVIYDLTNKPVKLNAPVSVPEECPMIDSKLIVDLVLDCIERVKLSLIIPTIFENPLTFYQILKGTKYEECAKSLLEYLKDRNGMDETCEGQSLWYDDKLIQLIFSFHRCNGFVKLLPEWYMKKSQKAQHYLKCLDSLAAIVSVHMNRSAFAALKIEKEMIRIHLQIEAFHKEAAILRLKLAIQEALRKRKTVTLGSFADLLKKENELTSRKKKNLQDRIRTQNINARRIRNLRFDHDNKIQKLEEEIKMLQLSFEILKKKNAKEKKAARAERYKFIAQLQAIAEKRDRVILEMKTENVYLQDEFDEKQREMKVFMTDYLKLEKAYNEIVKPGKMRPYRYSEDPATRTQAATCIQRYWRAYLKTELLWVRAKKRGKAKGKALTRPMISRI